MKWKKSIASLALAGCMLASSVPAVAFAANETVIEQTVKADKLETAIAGTFTSDDTNTSGEWEELKSTDIDTGDSEITISNSAGQEAEIEMYISSRYLSDKDPGEITYSIDGEDVIDESNIEATYTDGLLSMKLQPKAEEVGDATVTITFTTPEEEEDIEVEVTVHVIDPVYAVDFTVPESLTLKSDDTTGEKVDFKFLSGKDGVEVTEDVDLAEDIACSFDVDLGLEYTNGVIKAKAGEGKAGSTTATFAYDTHDGKHVTKTCTIIVTSKDAKIELKDKENGTYSSVDVDDTVQLKVTFTNMAETTVSYTSSDQNVATVDANGLVTAKKAGKTVITATAEDQTATYVLTVIAPGVSLESVALNHTSLTMVQGSGKDPKDASETLEVVYTPTDTSVQKDATIKWFVEGVEQDTGKYDADAITIDPATGKICVGENVKPGSYRVTARVEYTQVGAEDKTTEVLECYITVTQADASAVEKVEFKDKTAGTADVETISLNTNVLTDLEDLVKTVVTPTALSDLVDYSIDNTSVAKVEGNADDGWKIVGLKEGSCVLTATVGEESDTLVVNVTDPESNVLKGIKLNKSATGMVVDETMTLEVTALLDDSKKYDTLPDVYSSVWSSSDEDVATVNKNGKVSAVGAGTATITVTVGGYSATCTVVVVDPNAKPDVKPEPEVPTFDDVADGTWYKDAVSAVVAEGWMDGTADKIFEPETNLSRAMAAQILWAKNNKPYVKYEGKFSDVETNDWYANAISWASSKGIVSGRSDTIFDPKGDISRQDFALMLFKEENATAPENTTALDKYADKNEIAEYAAPAFAWAVEKGIISGVGENAENARPTWTMTRAQAAQMFSHLIPTEEA